MKTIILLTLIPFNFLMGRTGAIITLEKLDYFNFHLYINNISDNDTVEIEYLKLKILNEGMFDLFHNPQNAQSIISPENWGVENDDGIESDSVEIVFLEPFETDSILWNDLDGTDNPTISVGIHFTNDIDLYSMFIQKNDSVFVANLQENINLFITSVSYSIPIRLTWDHNGENIYGYKLYYGNRDSLVSNGYIYREKFGQINITKELAQDSIFCAVQAIDMAGNESDLSEVIVFVPETVKLDYQFDEKNRVDGDDLDQYYYEYKKNHNHTIWKVIDYIMNLVVTHY